MPTVILNDLFPGSTPPGTEAELLSRNGTSAVVLIGKKRVKCSPRWLDFSEPVIPRRPLRVRGGMWG